MPNKEKMKRKALEKAHNARYSVHLRRKMYRDLRQYFWWYNMKKRDYIVYG